MKRKILAAGILCVTIMAASNSGLETGKLNIASEVYAEEENSENAAEISLFFVSAFY